MVGEETRIRQALDVLVHGFHAVLYEEDEQFIANMRGKNLAGDDVRRYQFWEWPQGVGLFGLYNLYEQTDDPAYLAELEGYYATCMRIGLPAKNINTCAPMLTLAFLAKKTGKPAYRALCDEWATWLCEKMPRTEEGGFQHMTSDSRNDGELWDDTLFMAVLFLGVWGRISGNDRYSQLAQYQMLVHQKYLMDKQTGLWYHGWSFSEHSNFAGAFWGRGNCWITACIPLFLAYAECPPALCRYLTGLLQRQVDALVRLQDSTGLWHTLLDDPTSYLEVSATCGFGFGMLAGIHQGLLSSSCREAAMAALEPVLANISPDGVVGNVSYGTPMGRTSKDFYKHIPLQSMPYGSALAILFLSEALKEFGCLR